MRTSSLVADGKLQEPNTCGASERQARFESRHRSTHYLAVGVSVEGLGENGHHKHVDEERDKRGQTCFEEEVLVGLFNVFDA